jgi:hypothetical protein
MWPRTPDFRGLTRMMSRSGQLLFSHNRILCLTGNDHPVAIESQWDHTTRRSERTVGQVGDEYHPN